MTDNVRELFNKFVDALVGINGIEETFAVIKTSGQEVLKELGVVKWKCIYYTLVDAVIKEEIRAEDIFIIDESRADSPTVVEAKDYHTPNGGNLGLEMYRIESDIWTDEMREDLLMVMNMIFIALGRGRVYTSYEKANLSDLTTGAPNQIALVRFISKLAAEDKSHLYVAAFMNIKNFRWINDKYGSEAGDEYIKEFSRRCMNQMIEEELFARLGGDNFVALVKKENLIDKDDKLRNMSFSLNIEGEKVEFKPKVRAGLYALNRGDGMHEVMQGMSTALQYARLPDSLDFVWYQPYMGENGKKLRDLQVSFPIGLKNKEFVAFYQPKVSLKDLKLCGAEALCRWEKNGEFVSPMDFIPDLEVDGSIIKLDFYMLELVCQDIADMEARGINPGKISVNFSKHHLNDKNFGDRIVAIIDMYGIKHDNIEIELTEMYSCDDFTMVKKFVSLMNEAGIATSLDDFGTGYSSLNMLTSVETDIIKMDKSFMDDLDTKPEKHRSMVRNIINMINELGMESLAEGVENVKQYELLKNWNCSTVQGYLFDKPLPKEEFERRVLNPVYASP